MENQNSLPSYSQYRIILPSSLPYYSAAHTHARTQVALNGRAILIADTQRDWRIDTKTDADAAFRCVLAVPIKDLDGKMRAVLRAANKKVAPASTMAWPSSSSLASSSSSGGLNMGQSAAASASVASTSSAKAAHTSGTLSPPPPSMALSSASSSSSSSLLSAVASTFVAEDQDLLTAVATTASGILSIARLYDEAIERRAQTEALLRISGMFTLGRME